MLRKFKTYILIAPRWFAAPYFLAAMFLGSVVSGGIHTNTWIAAVATLLIMASGHVLNGAGDWMTGLDSGEVEERSAEKAYTGGSNLIAKKILSLRETWILGVVYIVLAFIPVIYLAIKVSWLIVPVAVVGMTMTFWYSFISKFNYTHELSLGIACGPLPAIIGALAVNPSPNWINVLLASVPFMIILSFAGLALDEWEDAAANLKKGVRSLAYEVWKWSDWVEIKKRLILTRYEGTTTYYQDQGEQTVKVKSFTTLQWYLSSWFLFMFFYQGLLINIGVFKPLTGLCFITFPAILACMLKIKSDFKKWAAILVIVGAVYEILLVLGMVYG